MACASHQELSLIDHVELIGSVIPRLTPFVLVAMFGPVVGHLFLVRAGLPPALDRPALILTAIVLGTVAVNPMFAPWWRPIQPDARTRDTIVRQARVYARYGGFGSLWITTDALHVVSPGEHHVYPLSSITEVVVQRATNPLEPLCPIPLHYSLLVRLRPGAEEIPTIREVPLFVLAPVSVARSIRRAIRANTDERPSCLYRQGETT